MAALAVSPALTEAGTPLARLFALRVPHSPADVTTVGAAVVALAAANLVVCLVWELLVVGGIVRRAVAVRDERDVATQRRRLWAAVVGWDGDVSGAAAAVATLGWKSDTLGQRSGDQGVGSGGGD
ncbi:hypothetical protein HK405_014839, partial [Cladochytrium tenue]